MQMSATALRRGLYGMFAGALLMAGVVAMVPAAHSAPSPCSPTHQAQGPSEAGCHQPNSR
ncbi:hypothetical protein [Mycobacterium kyorinense]|uniref:hypothetical protein n=1 Tax=Mycobacterium kyorinense TaxID=487514 RepID=UPI000A720052|nr:hypothetical protein [Mycobacterium kyorinense]